MRRLRNPLVLLLMVGLLGTAAWLASRVFQRAQPMVAIESHTIDVPDDELGHRLRPGLVDARIVIPAMPMPRSVAGDIDRRLRARGAMERTIEFTVRTNSLGFRSPEIRRRPPRRTFRVACLGDSTTFGWGMAEADAYPRVMEREVAARLPAGADRWEVLNAGVPAYDLARVLRLLERDVLPLRPDLVTVCMLGDPLEPDPVAAHRRRLVELVRLTRDAGVALALLCPPSSSFDLWDETPRFRDAMAEVAAEHGVLFVDFMALLEDARRGRGLALEVDGDLQRLVHHGDGGREVLVEVHHRPAGRDDDLVAPEIYAAFHDSGLSEATMLDDGHPDAEGQRLMGELLAERLLAAFGPGS